MVACRRDVPIGLHEQELLLRRLSNDIASLRREGVVLREMLSQMPGRHFDEVKFQTRVHSRSFADAVKTSKWTPTVSCLDLMALPWFAKMLATTIPEEDLYHARMISKRIQNTFTSQNLTPTRGMYIATHDGSIQLFNPAVGTWSILTSRVASVVILGHSTSAMAGQLYIAGGRSLECFDPAAGTWRGLAPMLEYRTHHSASVIAGRLYLIGGSPRLNSAERFDPTAGIWQPLAAMRDRRQAPSASLMAGRLYAAGGKDRSSVALRSVECFDPIAGRWQMLSDMSTQRMGHSASVISGRLYVAGGTRGSSGQTLSSMESFDPQVGIWQTLAPMSEKRVSHSASIIAGQLYIVGGSRSLLNHLNSVERFDPIQADTGSDVGPT